ncbi:MAG: ribonuclease III [Vampirovibrionales bacterium]
MSRSSAELLAQFDTRLNELASQLGLSTPLPEHELHWLRDALTHSSYAYEQRQTGHADAPQGMDHYERLEFLGDAVLKLLVSEYLFERFPHYREGELTKIRAVVVSDAMLADFARILQLGQYMRFGPNEERQGGRNKQSSLACGLESLLGALFLNGRLGIAKRVLDSLLDDAVTHVDLDPTKNNYKAALQERTQAEGLGVPTYTTVHESGPAHRRQFTVEVSVAERVVGVGVGRTKKEAQQNAAADAFKLWEQDG